MFPEAVRDRLLNDDEDEKKKKKDKKDGQFINNGNEEKSSTAPIADFYPETTILFADLVGFTVRSPGNSTDASRQLDKTADSLVNVVSLSLKGLVQRA